MAHNKTNTTIRAMEESKVISEVSRPKIVKTFRSDPNDVCFFIANKQAKREEEVFAQRKIVPETS